MNHALGFLDHPVGQAHIDIKFHRVLFLVIQRRGAALAVMHRFDRQAAMTRKSLLKIARCDDAANQFNGITEVAFTRGIGPQNHGQKIGKQDLGLL